MDLKKKVTISWSGGKDSAFALYKIIETGLYEVSHLHTVFNADSKRVGLHGVHEELVERQAHALGLPLIKLYLPPTDNHEAYQHLMRSFYRQCGDDKINGVVFGDIFLEDLKMFREELLVDSGLSPLFPLWKLDTKLLIHDFISRDFKTIICAANKELFDRSAVGKTINESFVSKYLSGFDRAVKMESITPLFMMDQFLNNV
jgi:uncharacterized protein (TIGR00290 family)